jgi:hypothetical protein
LPTQLTYFFWPEFSFVYGIRVDYLAPTIYFIDILWGLVLLVWVFRENGLKGLSKYKTYLAILLALALVNSLFSQIPFLSAYKWVRAFELFSIFVFIKSSRGVANLIKTPIAFGIIFSMFLSIAQIVNGGSLGGLFYWIGERSFVSSTLGISLMNIFGKVFIRPYAAFAHPNALAGYALLSLLFLKNFKDSISKIGVAASLAVVIISFSQNAWTALILTPILVYIIKRTKSGLSKFIVSAAISSFFLTLMSTSADLPREVLQRVELNVAAGKILSANPLLGVGLGAFIPTLPGAIHQSIWWLQPVHNMFLLVAAETGLVGLLLFVYVLYKNANATNLPVTIAIVLLGMWDHYMITIWPVLVFAVILLALGDVGSSDRIRAND